MLRLKVNGLAWFAPICSSFVAACYSVSLSGCNLFIGWFNYIWKQARFIIFLTYNIRFLQELGVEAVTGCAIIGQKEICHASLCERAMQWRLPGCFCKDHFLVYVGYEIFFNSRDCSGLRCLWRTWFSCATTSVCTV